MDDALPLFGFAALLWGAGFVIHALGYWWFRAKQLDRTHPPQTAIATASPAIEARLAGIEAAVEAVAVEVERLGEVHRFVARLQGERAEAEGALAPTHQARGHDRG
jgi:hypothetical protein